MFPLGTVLFPGALLPLHVFEPRYREMVRDCLAGTPEFGVVLIERGSEVGGGDVRTTVGTRARILQAEETEDGRWAIVAAGLHRLAVRRWLPDDPYPQAEVEDWPDGDEVDDDTARADDAAEAALRRVLALQAELGEATAPATVRLTDDPVLRGYQLCAISPLGPADQQRLLAAPTASERSALLLGMLTEEAEVLGQRLAMG